MWPETLGLARRRFANRILEAAHEWSSGSAHFALVSHAECVATGAALLLHEARVEAVCHGGQLLAVQSEGLQADLPAGFEMSKAKARSVALRGLQLQHTQGVTGKHGAKGGLCRRLGRFMQNKHPMPRKTDYLLSQLPDSAFACQESKVELGLSPCGSLDHSDSDSIVLPRSASSSDHDFDSPLPSSLPVSFPRSSGRRSPLVSPTPLASVSEGSGQSSSDEEEKASCPQSPRSLRLSRQTAAYAERKKAGAVAPPSRGSTNDHAN